MTTAQIRHERSGVSPSSRSHPIKTSKVVGCFSDDPENRITLPSLADSKKRRAPQLLLGESENGSNRADIRNIPASSVASRSWALSKATVDPRSLNFRYRSARARADVSCARLPGLMRTTLRAELVFGNALGKPDKEVFTEAVGTPDTGDIQPRVLQPLSAQPGRAGVELADLNAVLRFDALVSSMIVHSVSSDRCDADRRNAKTVGAAGPKEIQRHIGLRVGAATGTAARNQTAIARIGRASALGPQGPPSSRQGGQIEGSHDPLHSRTSSTVAKTMARSRRAYLSCVGSTMPPGLDERPSLGRGQQEQS